MQLRVDSDQYIFPPRPQTAMPFGDAAFFTEVGWGWQYKVNDSRCLVKFCGGGVELWNRHGERFRSYTCPDWLRYQLLDVRDLLGLSRSEVSILDGGLLDQKHAAIKDTVVIWDILVRDGVHLLGDEYLCRFESIAVGEVAFCYSNELYEAPVRFGRCYGDCSNVFHLEWCPDGSPKACWDRVQVINSPFGENSPLIEGMVFKDPVGRLEMGLREKNNENWLCRTRVKTGRHPF